MKRVFLTIGLSVALLGVACDSKEQCVADCDSQGSSGSTSAGESGSGSDEGTDGSSGGGSLQCDEHAANVSQFVEENGDCETVLDCVEVEAICYSGVESPCGLVGLSASADLDAWESVYGELTSNCECEGANACGSVVMCNDEQQCESSFGDEAYCPSIEQDVQTFLAANRECTVDEDCVALESICYVDDCSVVAVNVDTDAADWERLDQLLWDCDVPAESVCNFVGECGPTIGCGDDGQCEAVF